MAAAGTMSAAALQDYHTKRHTSGIVMDDEALVHALRDVKSESRTNWMACTYDANNSQTLRLLASGEGGFLELIESLTDTLVVYGCFMAVYEGQSKCVFVTWVGPDVSPMTRARVSMHKSDVMNWFQPVVSFDVDEREGLNLCSDVIAKIKGKLSSLGEKEIFLNSNEAHGAASSSAEAVLSQSEWDPLPALATSVASAGSKDEVALLTKALVATGLGERAAASFASEVSPPLVGEVRAVAAALQDCTAASAGSAVALSMEEGGGGDEASSEAPPPAAAEPPAPTEGAASVASFVGRLLPQIWRKSSAVAVAGEEGGERAASGSAEIAERLAPLRGKGLRLSLCLVLRAHLAVRQGDWAAEFAKLALPLLIQGVARLADERPDWLHSRSQAAKCVSECTSALLGLAAEEDAPRATAVVPPAVAAAAQGPRDAPPPGAPTPLPGATVPTAAAPIVPPTPPLPTAVVVPSPISSTPMTPPPMAAPPMTPPPMAPPPMAPPPMAPPPMAPPPMAPPPMAPPPMAPPPMAPPPMAPPPMAPPPMAPPPMAPPPMAPPPMAPPPMAPPPMAPPPMAPPPMAPPPMAPPPMAPPPMAPPPMAPPPMAPPPMAPPQVAPPPTTTAPTPPPPPPAPPPGGAKPKAPLNDQHPPDASPETSADVEEVTIERRQLFWKKIVQPARLADSVFGELEGVLDSVKQSVGQQLEAEVSSLFTRKKVAQQLTEAERIGQEVGAIGGVLKAGSLTFLNQQRFNNIAIPLTQLGLDNRVIRDAVVTMDTSVLTPPVVSLLMDCAPTADDVEAISFYDGDPALLAQVERFFWEVHKVPLFSKRLAALHASHGFMAQALGVQKLLETVSSAMAQLQCSSGFEMVLALLLLAGNAMNSGGVRGDACAFDLEVLTKLADVRSMHRGVAGRSHSLLQMLVSLAEERLPDTAARWVEQLSAMDEACRIPFSRIFAELAELTRAVKLVEAVHTAASKLKPPAGAPVDPFVRVMGAWLEQSTAITNDLRRQLQQATRVYAACARRLCVDAAEGPEVLFGRLAAFASQWKAARAANHAAAARVAREEWLAKQKQERLAAIEERRRRLNELSDTEAESNAAANDTTPASRRLAACPTATVGVRRAKLPTNGSAEANAVLSAAAASGGGAKGCGVCGTSFRGWGATCHNCRGKTSKPPPRPSAAAAGDTCAVCFKKVYEAERLVAAGLLFHRKSAGHRGCFRCKHCDVPLASSNFACAGTSSYCHAHFKQLFAREGNYNFAADPVVEGKETAPGPVNVAPLPAAAPDTPPPAAASPALTPSPAPTGYPNEEANDVAVPTCYMYGDLRIPFELEDGWQRVCEASFEQNWVLCSYDREDTCQIEVVGEGTGGLTECLANTTDDRVYWGGFRVVAVDSQRGVVSRRPKHCFFMLAGPATPLKVKTRGLLHMGAIAAVLQQAHVSFEVENVDELSHERVAEKLLQCGGAHKPNSWEFGDGESFHLSRD